MGKKSRSKGARTEREIVNLCKEMGLADARRVPLSGAVAGYKGDVEVAGFRCEVKGRAKGQGFAMLERWLGDFDILFLRRDRQKPLVLLSWPTWEKLMRREGP